MEDVTPTVLEFAEVCGLEGLLYSVEKQYEKN